MNQMLLTINYKGNSPTILLRVKITKQLNHNTVLLMYCQLSHIIKNFVLRFQVLVVVKPCSVVQFNPEDEGDTVLQKIGSHLRDYTVLKHKRQQLENIFMFRYTTIKEIYATYLQHLITGVSSYGFGKASNCLKVLLLHPKKIKYNV